MQRFSLLFRIVGAIAHAGSDPLPVLYGLAHVLTNPAALAAVKDLSPRMAALGPDVDVILGALAADLGITTPAPPAPG